MIRAIYRIVIAIIFACTPVFGAETAISAKEALKAKLPLIQQKPAQSPFVVPVHLDSVETGSSSAVNIYGIVNYPIATIRKELLQPEHWCDVTILHTNVRACTWRQTGDTARLILSTVKKNTRPIEDAAQMKYDFRIAGQHADYLDIRITAEEGPYSTRDHVFRFEATPLEAAKTLIHLSYSYGYSTLGYIGMKSYFALFSRGHVGFTIAGLDDGKKPVYVKGLKGAVERNIMRYYLGILAHLDTLQFPAEQQFEKRIHRWFALTELHRRQLHALEKKEYLSYKRQDQKNSQKLQAAQQ
jgi:hypothetical protein